MLHLKFFDNCVVSLVVMIDDRFKGFIVIADPSCIHKLIASPEQEPFNVAPSFLIIVLTLQACTAYTFISIPSIKNIQTRLFLYLESGQVALISQCVTQGW